MIISCIVATSNGRVIGLDNNIPWYLPADLKYFKQTTLGRTVIMGRNCYVSIGRPLPKRTNIIVTRDPFFISSNCLVARTIPEALNLAYQNRETETFIIGGGQIYEQTKDLWDKLYLTEVHTDVDGDVFFPEINMEKWKLIFSEKHCKDEKNEFDYTFKIFDKI
ncbi:MAG: dihydrofolate reductase [Saprospiraceae bacterium]|jgi:dihydrofolate reductase|nr:dihydrofolate reductase [Saprospiraceae bacterium]MBL0023490.1 dihydrofolate reductase [Saprospiraceae bacterium]